MANGIGKKVEQAKELIIREIWNTGLQHGDQLPSCGTLSKKMHLGRATVFRAVKELQEEGILESRDRVGIYIADPRTPGHAGYQVGLIIGNMNSSSFNNLLSIYLQSQCMNSGCHCLMFHSSTVLRDTSRADSLSTHIGVREQIMRKELHGLLTQISFSKENKAFLKKHNIPYCFTGGFSPAPDQLSVVISLEKVIRMGVERLLKNGCKRPYLLLPRGVCTEKEIKDLLGSSKVKCHFYSTVDDVINYGRELIALPGKERPDGLLIPDDEAAHYFCAALYHLPEKEWHPYFVILAPEERYNKNNCSIRLPMPENTDILTFSLAEMVEKAVSLLLKSMRRYSSERQEEEVALYWHKNKKNGFKKK